MKMTKHFDPDSRFQCNIEAFEPRSFDRPIDYEPKIS